MTMTQTSPFRHSSVLARFRKCGGTFLETLLRQNSKNIQYKEHTFPILSSLLALQLGCEG
jgi:hypothetical protein